MSATVLHHREAFERNVVKSTQEDGTTFTLRLKRRPPPHRGPESSGVTPVP
jgi:hypothetical protein